MEKSGFFWTLRKVIFRQKNEGFGGGKIGIFGAGEGRFLGWKNGDFGALKPAIFEQKNEEF